MARFQRLLYLVVKHTQREPVVHLHRSLRNPGAYAGLPHGECDGLEQLLASANLAAFAGIAWYIIFMRWSYRHRPGRGTERTLETEVMAAVDCLIVRRGLVETRIEWAGIRKVDVSGGNIAVYIDGADTLIIPHEWFGGDSARRAAFTDYVTAKVAH